MNDSKARCYPKDDQKRLIFVLPIVYVILLFLSMLLVNKTFKPSFATFNHLYGVSDSAIGFYGSNVSKCGAVLFGWMAYTALMYLMLVLFVPCDNSQDRENWAGPRWAMFYSTHFWYIASILFWAFCSLDIHTYPEEAYAKLIQERKDIETNYPRYVEFFNRVVGGLDNSSETEGIMYAVLILSAIVTWLSFGVSIGTQIYGTNATTGYFVWATINLVFTGSLVISVIAWLAWGTYNHMTGCQKGLGMFERRMEWHKLTDILAFESMREHVVQKELPYRLCHPLYHASWFISLALVLIILYIVILIQNFNAFAHDSAYAAIKLGRNILAVLVIMFAMLYFRKFADLHATHNDNHLRLLRKCIVDLQVERLRRDAEVYMIKTNMSQTDPEASQIKISALHSQIEEYGKMVDTLEKMQSFQDGLDPLYAVRIFGIRVTATPALVSAITGSIGAYVAVIFSLFVNQLTA